MLKKLLQWLMPKNKPGNPTMGMRFEAEIIVRNPDGKIKAKRKVKMK